MKRIGDTHEEVLRDLMSNDVLNISSERTKVGDYLTWEMHDVYSTFLLTLAKDYDLNEDNLNKAIASYEVILGKLLAYRDYFYR